MKKAAKHDTIPTTVVTQQQGGLGGQQREPLGHGRDTGTDHAAAVLAGDDQHAQNEDGDLGTSTPLRLSAIGVPSALSLTVISLYPTMVVAARSA